jgi:hypothetical protein
MAVDLQAKLEGQLDRAGLLPYLDKDESRFIQLGDNFFAEIVASDSTRLPDFGRIAEAAKSEDPRINTLVRAHWEVARVGDPMQAFDVPGTGAPRFAVQYPVWLKSGRGATEARVEVTTLASMTLKRQKLDEKNIVRGFVEEQLSKGGASYWDPQVVPLLEINGDMAEYIASRKSLSTQ